MTKILPVASGKGGVGKSLFVANVGILLAQKGQKVLIVDLDLGGSNLHTMLGIKNDLKSIGHFINDKNITFSEIVHNTQVPNLDFVPGDSLFIGTANLPFFRKKQIVKGILSTDYDWVLLDLGAGTAHNTLDFYLASNVGVLVTTPEITSILNLYSFLKNAFYRHILSHYKKSDIIRTKLIEGASMRLEKEDFRLYEYLRLLKKDNPDEAEKLDGIINNFYPKIILNAAKSDNDIKLGENLRGIIHKNLGIESEYLGLLPEEKDFDKCLIERTPLALYNPASKWVTNCGKIADRLINFSCYPTAIYTDDADSVNTIIGDL